MKHFLAIAVLAAALAGSAWADEAERARLIEAVTNESPLRIDLIAGLSSSTDAMVRRALVAWRASELFVQEGTKVLFILDVATDADGRSAAIRVDTGEALLDLAGQPVFLKGSELTAVDTTSKLRKAIKRSIDLIALNDPDPKARRDAANRLGFEQNQEFLPALEACAAREQDPTTRKSFLEAAAITRLASPDAEVRRRGVTELGTMKCIGATDLLKRVRDQASAEGAKKDPITAKLADASLKQIDDHRAMVSLVGTGFRGLSLASVLLIAAIGLAITFGLMGVINMAHGEIIMVGAYTAYITQGWFVKWFGAAGAGFDLYFVAALATSFVVAATVGLVLERGLIRYLYKRPLESMLATWGVSLVLQQLFRTIFGAANVQVISPSWLSGSFERGDVLYAYNRIFVIGFAVLVVVATYLFLTRTSAGLQIRAVMQNRNMAASLGVSTSRVYARTFALGSGLAGVAGACLSQIGNVGPSLGQAHIVDCFMIVVLGGVGNLVGTVCASLGVGVVDQVLQPYLGAVMGKITVLAAIILFLQWRPAGLFVARSRALEG